MSSSSGESEATEAFVNETLRLEADEQEKEWVHVSDDDDDQHSCADDPKLIPTSTQSVVVEHTFLSQAMKTPYHGGSMKKGSTSTRVEESKDYNLPTSTLPPQFRLGFSSTLQLPHQAQQGNRTNQVSSLPKTNWPNRQPFSTPEPAINLGSQQFGFQALLNQVIASDNFLVNDDRPIQHRVGSSSIGVSSLNLLDGPSNSNKRKVSRQDETPPTPNLPFIDWMSIGEGDQGPKSSTAGSGSRPKMIQNKVYDPLYEAMGLPVDPHLRMFLARNANPENKDEWKDCGGSKTPRKDS